VFIKLQHVFALSFLAIRAQGLVHTRQSFARVMQLHRVTPSALRMGTDFDREVDVVVLGGGVAGTTLSWVLQEKEQLSVALVDPLAHVETGTWYPNYGEWREEWQTLSERLGFPELMDCTTHQWEKTDCFFGGSHGMPVNQRTRLDRAYVRVDKKKLQRRLREKFAAAGGVAVSGKLGSRLIAPNLFDQGLVHDAEGSTLTLEDGRRLRCRTLVDATGLESRLVQREEPRLARGGDRPLATGYQIAYGAILHVDGPGPYDMACMTLFDYRTDHFPEGSRELADAVDRPTFNYVMPLESRADGTKVVFYEETSLVGRGARRLGFQECKDRLARRLAHQGIQVLGVEEEEFCYIPMGGELPALGQRVVGFGGAANMVHPSTGYQACRALAASTDVAAAIGKMHRAGARPDLVAQAAWGALWGRRTRGQRDFQAYGGDFLMAQPVDVLRGFFSAFFQVETLVWGGFLAGWPGLPGNVNHETWHARLGFALNLFLKMPNEVRVAMILYSIGYTAQYGPNTLLRSLTPDILFGSGPEAWELPGGLREEMQIAQAIRNDAVPDNVGDVEAKEEAKKLMADFKKTGIFAGEELAKVPVPKQEESSTSEEETASKVVA